VSADYCRRKTSKNNHIHNLTIAERTFYNIDTFYPTTNQGEILMPETNKDAAVSFLKLGSSGKVNEAYAKYTDIRFVHHNPYFEG